MDLIRGQMGEKEETRGDLYGALSDVLLFVVGFSSRRRQRLEGGGGACWSGRRQQAVRRARCLPCGRALAEEGEG